MPSVSVSWFAFACLISSQTHTSSAQQENLFGFTIQTTPLANSTAQASCCPVLPSNRQGTLTARPQVSCPASVYVTTCLVDTLLAMKIKPDVKCLLNICWPAKYQRLRHPVGIEAMIHQGLLQISSDSQTQLISPTDSLATGLFRLGLGTASRDGYLFVPHTYQPIKPAKILLALHGADGNATQPLSLLLRQANTSGKASLDAILACYHMEGSF
jgi:hypothetical protein